MSQFEFVYRFGLTGAAAMSAEFATYPIDFVKTRLQVQGAIGSKTSIQGPVSLINSTIRNEGVLALYQGAGPAMLRHVPYSGTRILLYEQLRNIVQGNNGHKEDSNDQLSLASKLTIGFISGGIGQFVAVPMDVVKVRMQADGLAVRMGHMSRPRYSNVAVALSTIIRDEGFFALWRGAGPAVYRAALVNLGELSTYDTSKQLIIDNGVFKEGDVRSHVLASLCSGFAGAVVSTPMDVIKSRLMNQGSQQMQYQGVIDCGIKIFQNEGLVGFYRGFFPTWLRLGPWQLVFWVSYEQLRKIGGYGEF